MPRIKKTIHERASSYKADKFYVSETNILMCGICNIRLEWDKKDTLDKHCLTTSHLAKKKSVLCDPQSSNKRPATLFEVNERAKKAKTEKSEFVQDTVAMCLKSNIALHKLDHPAVREYLTKYVKGSGDLPSGDRLRRDYLPKCAEEEMERIFADFQGKKIVIVADETTDIKGRCVFAIVFRTVSAAVSQKVALASCSFLDKANGTTCSQAIIEAINKYSIDYNDVIGLVSDSARYMGTCFQGLQILIGDHLIHYQCWAHKVSLIGDVFMNELDEVNTLVSKLKMVFLHGRKIKNRYLSFLVENYPELSPVLFPKPIITRWNSWFRSIQYLGVYLDPLVAFLNQYDEKNASATKVCEMFEDSSSALMLKTQIIFITDICQPLIDLINNLEGSKFPYAHMIWNKLLNINNSLLRHSDGAFPERTTLLLAEYRNTVKKGLVTASITSACIKAHTKLVLHMRPCPANDLYKEAGTLFNPCLAGQKLQVKEAAIKTSKAKLPAFKNIKEDTFVESYLYFHRQLLERMREGDDTEVVQILLAMRPDHERFSTAALESIWTPVNSVDAERFFSCFNLVLNDRRTSLKEENLETCAMLKFNHCDA